MFALLCRVAGSERFYWVASPDMPHVPKTAIPPMTDPKPPSSREDVLSPDPPPFTGIIGDTYRETRTWRAALQFDAGEVIEVHEGVRRPIEPARPQADDLRHPRSG